jgi:hypothetical protein
MSNQESKIMSEANKSGSRSALYVGDRVTIFTTVVEVTFMG